MSRNQTIAGSVAYLAALAAVIFAIMTCVGCAHTCRPAEQRAAKLGTVLECLPVQDGTRCLISTPEGDIYHFYRDCE